MMGALLVGAAMFAACEDPNTGSGNGNNGGNDSIEVTPPVTDQPEVEPVEGKVVIVLNTVDEAEVCNGLVFAGDYNGSASQSDLNQMVRFEPIDGYQGWYRTEFTPNPEGSSKEGYIASGKPCQLASDGTFPSSWDYQWFAQTNDAGEVVNECEVIEGAAELYDEYNGEKGLGVQEGADVVYIRAHAWKKNPCVPAETYTIQFTATLTEPLVDSCTLHIAGGMNGWNTTATALTPNEDRTVWTVSIENCELDMEYKYLAVGVGGGQYWELKEAAEGADCAEAQGNRKISDREMNDKVYEFENLTLPKCKEEAQ